MNVGMIARNLVRTGKNDGEGSLGDDDVWVLFDGGRQIESALQKPFRKIAKKSKILINLAYDEDSMLANIGRVTTMGSLKCTETMLLVSSDQWSCPRRNHINYPGSNYSDQLGPIIVDTWEDDAIWKMVRKEKKVGIEPFFVDPSVPMLVILPNSSASAFPDLLYPRLLILPNSGASAFPELLYPRLVIKKQGADGSLQD